jgi:hypothetical protein
MRRSKTAQKIPSPLDDVMKPLAQRTAERCNYSFAMLTQLVLMAIGAKAANVLAVSH